MLAGPAAVIMSDDSDELWLCERGVVAAEDGDEVVERTELKTFLNQTADHHNQHPVAPSNR